MWNDKFRKSRVLPDKLVAMVTPDNLANHKKLSLMLRRLILKVTKFQLPPPRRLSTVVKNFFFFRGGGGCGSCKKKPRRNSWGKNVPQNVRRV